MKKINTRYWIVNFVCIILFIQSFTVVYAEENNSVTNDENIKNELIQNDKLHIADVHENTLIYNGKLKTDSSLSLSIKSDEEKKTEISVAPNGNFIIDFSQYKIKVGDKLIFHVTRDKEEIYEEQIEKTVLEKKLRAEIVLSEEDTPEEKKFAEALTLSDIYTHTKEVNGKTNPNTAVYLVSGGQMAEPIYSDETNGEFTWRFDGNREERYEDDVFQFVFVSDGMMIVLEKKVMKPTKEWETRVAQIKKATKLPDIHQGLQVYEGQTLPNSKIKGSFLNKVLVEVVSDKDGKFRFNGQVLSGIPLGKSLTLTITDSKSVYFSVEKEILSKKEEVGIEEEMVEEAPELNAKTEENLNEEQSSSENEFIKPSVEENKDKTVSLSPTKPKKINSKEPIDSKDDSVNANLESNLSSTKISSNSSPENTVNEIDKTKDVEKEEDSDFAILATIVMIGTVTMSGLLYKY